MQTLTGLHFVTLTVVKSRLLDGRGGVGYSGLFGRMYYWVSKSEDMKELGKLQD